MQDLVAAFAANVPSFFSHRKRPQDELHLGPELPRDASVEHLIMTTAATVVVNAAMATQVRRRLDAWEAQRHSDESFKSFKVLLEVARCHI